MSSPSQITDPSPQTSFALITEGVKDGWDWLLYAAIVCGFFFLIYQSFREDAFSAFSPILTATLAHKWLRLLAFPAFLWMGMGMVLLAFRTILWLIYSPTPPASLNDAPTLTVIIPAYNEGPMVSLAIDSAATANYPGGRLEVLAIDDGSTDDTWRHILGAAQRHPGIVRAIRQPSNRGKRAALALGFEAARGEIFVTMDSDSVTERNSFLALAGALRNPRVGAVAGRVSVYNRREGVIARMLQVRYTLAFDVVRSAESAYGTVYCCPGALTALRASAVRQVLERWKTQTFFGSPCTFGEDRALTNFLFERGYDTAYQRNAVVHTLVPEKYAQLCRMFLRWNRSYIREEIHFASIVWKRPLATRFISLYDRFVTNLRYPIAYASMLLLIALIAGHPFVLLRMLTAVGLVSFFNTLCYLRSERSPDFLYGVLYSYFSLFALFWIFPYALFTLRARSWLTR
jgi:hyaluronan synthase